MQTTATGQRRRANRLPSEPRVIRVELKDGLGHSRWVTADLLDTTEGGFGIALMTPLRSGSTVVVRGRIREESADSKLRVGVRWCVERADGTFRAGLEFLDGPAHSTPHEEPSAASNPEEFDCYEILQLSPNADPETINRVYRMLAQRYHPDNTETGNAEQFVRLSEAFHIVSDPEKRASYDARYFSSKRLQWKIFDQGAVPTGGEAEVRKRNGILGLLYAKTLHDPERAEMNIQMFEDLLGCPREHLEAALWYLKGKNYIKRSDNGRYSITIAGFDVAEANTVKPSSDTLRLPEASPRD